jgi:hypothetical protein
VEAAKPLMLKLAAHVQMRVNIVATGMFVKRQLFLPSTTTIFTG